MVKLQWMEQQIMEEILLMVNMYKKSKTIDQLKESKLEVEYSSLKRKKKKAKKWNVANEQFFNTSLMQYYNHLFSTI